MILLGALLLGLMVGSFLNVVIYRLPRMLEQQWQAQCAELQAAAAVTPAPAAPTPPAFNLVVPRSRCPSCQTQIKAWHNIPVFSWLWLRGRCAQCQARISARYPFVELLTGLLSLIVAWRFGYSTATVAALVLTWFLIALTFIDIDQQLLPDTLTLPLLWLGLLYSLWGNAVAPVDLRSSVLGAVVGYLSLWSVYQLFRLATGKEGMGYGDFKLLAALGAWLGWQMLLPIILLAAAVGAVVGMIVLARQGRSQATPIAFGPFLAAAGWLMLLFGPQLVQRYLGLFNVTP